MSELSTRLREAAEVDGEHRWSKLLLEAATAMEADEYAWDRPCCRREREAIYEAAKAQEERGWGRKGYHPIADGIRGRGEWIKYLQDRAARAAHRPPEEGRE